MKQIFIIAAILLAACSTEDACKCTVDYQTTRTGQWKTESTRTVGSYEGTCEDRTNVLVMPIIVGPPGGAIYSSNGIREVIACD